MEETAEFMADFVNYDTKSKRFFLQGATAMQESMSKDFSFNHPFELSYWQYGLSIANEWRKRQGKDINRQWNDIIAALASLPQDQSGIYTAGLPKGKTDNLESFDPFDTAPLSSNEGGTARKSNDAPSGAVAGAYETFVEKCRNDHPAVLGACGLLPSEQTPYTLLYNKEKMTKTLDWVMQNWNWQTTWGWDYGMIAMAAARLGEPETALKALLIDTQKNTYLKNGHNFQTADRLRCYLPGNGALLTAVAMMCAGWDGCKEPLNPGFPKDGQWNVRWEGLQRMQ